MTQPARATTPTPEEAAALVRRPGNAALATDDAANAHSAVPEPAAGQAGSQHDAERIHLPSPSIWPITAAFGVTMISFGVLTGWAFGIFGGVVLAIGLWQWVSDMRSDAA